MSDYVAGLKALRDHIRWSIQRAYDEGEDDHEIFLWKAAGAGKRRASTGGGSVGGGVGEGGRDKEDPTFNPSPSLSLT